MPTERLLRTVSKTVCTFPVPGMKGVQGNNGEADCATFYGIVCRDVLPGRYQPGEERSDSGGARYAEGRAGRGGGSRTACRRAREEAGDAGWSGGAERTHKIARGEGVNEEQRCRVAVREGVTEKERGRARKGLDRRERARRLLRR